VINTLKRDPWLSDTEEYQHEIAQLNNSAKIQIVELSLSAQSDDASSLTNLLKALTELEYIREISSLNTMKIVL
jgi:PHP family Zn ribbon phosphoesterase